LRLVETILRIGGERIKENDGGDEFKICCKYFCKCHHAHTVQQYDNKKQILKKKK
jgi:hypothetical protein